MNIHEFTFLIKHKKENNFFEHLKTFFFRRVLCGNFDGEKIIVWSSYRDTGIFYPVFEIKKVIEQTKPRLKIIHRMNVVGKIIGWMIVIGFWIPSLLIISKIHLSDLTSMFPSLLLTAIFGLIPIIIHNVVYPREVKRQEKFIKDIITEYIADSASSVE